jgi:hypothetical protein
LVTLISVTLIMTLYKRTRLVRALDYAWPEGGPALDQPRKFDNQELTLAFTHAHENKQTPIRYVSHLTFMVAKYLEVPFRFPMRPMCSRSTVVDEVSSVPSEEDRTYPL